MTKARLLGISVLVLVGFGAVASMQASSQQPPERVTILLFDPNKTGFEKRIDVGKAGLGTPGDFGVSKDPLLDPDTCESAGMRLARFTLIKLEKDDGFDIAENALLLPDGKITLTFGTRFSELEGDGSPGAVTGGTGSYEDVRGQALFTEGQEKCEQRGVLITLDLLLQ